MHDLPCRENIRYPAPASFRMRPNASFLQAVDGRVKKKDRKHKCPDV
ncbi:hypothetical protein Memar_1278 [Methanoculleus marisnigri JR1]|uniref:Uncharacterized protein n=1 Tax=Methanoculleus marisnigri (strain ATCC 35101 / DSM 1498 / JR1) TaxID=368407 RepID=A3CV08_METMJ|nr:hypothetical protein Memar_1278 [Methanoculleus marisnigri JR1]